MNVVDLGPNRLDIAREAVVFGGNLETPGMLAPLKNELCDGNNAIFDSIVDESPNVADLIANPDKFKKMIQGKTLLVRSLTSVATSDEFAAWRRGIQGMIIDAPVEPIGILKTFYRGGKLFFDRENKATAEDELYVPGKLEQPKAAFPHLITNAKNPLLAARFSTIKAISGAPDGSFNGGIAYFERKDDQFGYNLVHGVGGAVKFMRMLSYDAATLEGNHMAGLCRPASSVAQIKDYLENRSQSYTSGI
jgi:hypothetical protein